MWFLLWFVLVIGALALIGWLGYRVVRKGLGLGRELGDVSAQLAEVSHQARRAFETRLALAADDEATTAGTAGERAPLISRAGLR